MLQRSPQETVNATDSARIAFRRALFVALFAVSFVGMMGLLAAALSPGGFGLLDILLLAMFAVTLPWTIVGFWHAMIGFLILRFSDDPSAAVLPAVRSVRGDEPIAISTAIVMCIRNEMPERIIRNLEPMMSGLDAANVAGQFHVYVLSDTSDPAVATAEETSFAVFAARWQGRLTVTYRRREVNTGFKAGNIRDFCERWGSQHELMLPLDVDSFMTAEAVLRLVRIMQADTRIGILQGLVIGMPSTSAFARIFQFGMRLGMRSYTIGAAWWQGDCGPYWGHNAAVRIAPFTAHCQLPVFDREKGSATHILSHDQIEGALMRRAGYEVRVLPEEGFSWEENPPTLIEFIRRDLRWCQGNMQYWPFLMWSGIKPVSRYQLAIAISMFLGSPAWMGLLAVSTLMLALAKTPADVIWPDAGLAVFWLTLLMWFAPKIASATDVLTRREARRAFGGTLRFLGNFAIEVVFFILLCPIQWFGHAAFMAGLPFGRGIGWIGQARDDHKVSLLSAVRNFWLHTAFGLTVVVSLALTHPSALPYALFLAAGPALAIPLAIATALPGVGRAFVRWGIGRLPEETAPPSALSALALPAIALAAPAARPRAA